MANIYLLYNQLNKSSNKFIIKNCLLDAVELTRNTIKSKLIYSGYVTPFDGVGSLSLGDKSVVSVSARVNQNILEILQIFIYISSRSTHGINDNVVETKKKKIRINFLKSRTKFCLSSHYHGNNICLYIKKDIFMVLRVLIIYPLIFFSLEGVSNVFFN